MWIAYAKIRLSAFKTVDKKHPKVFLFSLFNQNSFVKKIHPFLIISPKSRL